MCVFYHEGINNNYLSAKATVKQKMYIINSKYDIMYST